MPSSRKPEPGGPAEALAAVEAVWQGMREGGVRLTAEQLIAGYQLAAVLDSQGIDDPRRLRGMLAGVFAKSAADLELFEQLFGARYETTPPTVGDKADRPARRRPRLASLIAGAELASAISATAGSVAVALWPEPKDPVPGATQLKPCCAPPAPQALGLTLRQETRDVTILVPPPWWPAAQAAVIAAPLLLVLLLLLWRRARAPRWTRLSPDEQEALMESSLPPASGKGVFAGPALRALARSLRRTPRPAPGRELDVERTVMATARAGGQLTPVFTAPPRRRTLHVAVERLSQEDHLPQLYARAATVLDGLGARVRLFSFRGDPRVLNDEDGRPVAAAAAAQADGETLLAVVGDGEGFFQPTGGKLDAARWRALEHWDRRFLLSLRRTVGWGWREERLVAEGLSVGPADGRGLEALAAQLDRETPGAVLTKGGRTRRQV